MRTGCGSGRKLPTLCNWPTFTLKKGTIVYHGTAAVEEISKLHTPAWVSLSRDVAEDFVNWSGAGGSPRILSFKVTADIDRLALLHNAQELQDLIDLIHPAEDFGATPHEWAQIICVHFAGWHIPNYYPHGDDTLIRESTHLDLMAVSRRAFQGQKEGPLEQL